MVLRAPLLLLTAVISGCASMFPFNYTQIAPGPVQVGTEWTLFTFKPPMEAALREKGVLLELPGNAKWADVHQGIVRIDGKQTELIAEAIDIDGRVHPLPFISPILPTGHKELYVVLLSQEFPQPVILSGVRVKGSEQVTFGRVLWMNSTPH